MRFWFRALADIIAGPDTSLRAKLEGEVFGSTTRPSAFAIRIPDQPPVTLQPFLPAVHRARAGGWTAYLLGPRLATTRASGMDPIPHLSPGTVFDICLKSRGSESAESRMALALASLWLACAYGGVGARTHRGFGGLRIIAADGPLPDPWTHQAVLSPGLSHYENIRRLWPAGPVGDCVPLLARLAAPHGGLPALAQWTSPPPYPVLSRTHTLVGTSGGGTFSTWADVAEYAGEQLRNFRTSGAARDAALEGAAAVARVVPTRDSARFPAGALGLPVAYRDGDEINAYQDRIPLRRPSPLWLRPVGEAGHWRLLSYAFLGQFLPGPNPPQVRLHHRGRPIRELKVTDDDIVALATRWITTLAADGTFIR